MKSEDSLVATPSRFEPIALGGVGLGSGVGFATPETPNPNPQPWKLKTRWERHLRALQNPEVYVGPAPYPRSPKPKPPNQRILASNDALVIRSPTFGSRNRNPKPEAHIPEANPKTRNQKSEPPHPQLYKRCGAATWSSPPSTSGLIPNPYLRLIDFVDLTPETLDP